MATSWYLESYYMIYNIRLQTAKGRMKVTDSSKRYVWYGWYNMQKGS